MFGDLHIHMILDGVYYRAAIDAQKEHPLDGLVRARLSDYQARGVCLLARRAGTPGAVSLRARELAGEYGIDYRSPAFPIYRRGTMGPSSAAASTRRTNTAPCWTRQGRSGRTSSSS